MATNNIKNTVKMNYVSSGSLQDISATGIYYCTGSVTDKPDAQGGMYIVSCFGLSNSVGLYIPLYGSGTYPVYVVRSNGGTFSSQKLQQIKTTTITGTTTSSGAILMPTAVVGRVLAVNYGDSHVGNVFARDRSYFTCFDLNSTPIANESVTLDVTYYE